ncbi:MAG: DUF6171 family protein [Eubacterium sp.]|nr:DUF6171 family protein [Eubacterium sp.]
MNKCKKCLLLEAGEKVKHAELTAYLETIKDSLTDEATSNNRLDICKTCDGLISGMCLNCGCYVEIRARLKDAGCPKEEW